MLIHHRHLSTTTGAVAAAASIISGLVGVVAMFTTPHGIHRFAVALHIAHQPMLVRIAPCIAALAVLAGTIAGVLRLYSWGREVGQQGNEAATPK
jgi:hypothetical protein